MLHCCIICGLKNDGSEPVIRVALGRTLASIMTRTLLPSQVTAPWPTSTFSLCHHWTSHISALEVSHDITCMELPEADLLNFMQIQTHCAWRDFVGG